MQPDPDDLTAELDAAEAVAMHGATVKTEWGIRLAAGGDDRIAVYGTAPASERHARADADAQNPLVRRTVTYGPWEEADGA